MTAEEKAAADKAKHDAEEKEREDKAKKDSKEREDARAKADAATAEKLDKVLSFADSMSKFCDSMTKRMDAFEAKDKERDDAARKDSKSKKDEDMTEAERTAADKAKKDAEEKEKEEHEKADKAKKDAAEKERDDAAKADANEALIKQIKELEAKFAAAPMASYDPNRGNFTPFQARADAVAQLFSITNRAPEPMLGESTNAYRRRLLRPYLGHSPKWKDHNLDSAVFADDNVLKNVEDDVYNDAVAVANDPAATVADDQMLPRTRRMESGHTVIEYHGRSPARAWMNRFAGPVRNIHVGPIRLQKH